ncbi:hypothetical protein DFA_04781 [Cavenderia fasciculata]|uniref:Uncharacterized protein n=1 Tax=Cavenderia fasciculata TaxID=261658 RepID=F4PQI8_CACFS|nr:uncharacterized protein DFA_04781 [Cavenderia fasciculata]EGG22651.1 hypothetical protein DFA_04781 [Cavenderia fasciculata]|eukprot:XP_004360502.1 hypothetical protein DFA_04781 [Cavenderia fasciculata]
MKYLILTVFLLLSLFTNQSYQQAIEYDTTIDCSTPSGCDFYVGANWVGGVAPTAEQDAVINYQGDLAKTFTVYTFERELIVKSLTSTNTALIARAGASIGLLNVTKSQVDFTGAFNSTVQTIVSDTATFTISNGAAFTLVNAANFSADSSFSGSDNSSLTFSADTNFTDTVSLKDTSSLTGLTTLTFQSGVTVEGGATVFVNASIAGESSFADLNVTGTLVVLANSPVTVSGNFDGSSSIVNVQSGANLGFSQTPNFVLLKNVAVAGTLAFDNTAATITVAGVVSANVLSFTETTSTVTFSGAQTMIQTLQLTSTTPITFAGTTQIVTISQTGDIQPPSFADLLFTSVAAITGTSRTFANVDITVNGVNAQLTVSNSSIEFTAGGIAVTQGKLKVTGSTISGPVTLAPSALLYTTNSTLDADQIIANGTTWYPQSTNVTGNLELQATAVVSFVAATLVVGDTPVVKVDGTVKLGGAKLAADFANTAVQVNKNYTLISAAQELSGEFSTKTVTKTGVTLEYKVQNTTLADDVTLVQLVVTKINSGGNTNSSSSTSDSESEEPSFGTQLTVSSYLSASFILLLLSLLL